MSDPQIPAALLPAVAGVVSLHDFKPRPMLVPKAQYTVTSKVVPVVPGDLATIYNLNAAFSAGYTGQGQTIVVLEDSDLYNGTGDWNTFRQASVVTVTGAMEVPPLARHSGIPGDLCRRRRQSGCS